VAELAFLCIEKASFRMHKKSEDQPTLTSLSNQVRSLEKQVDRLSKMMELLLRKDQIDVSEDISDEDSKTEN